MGDRWVVAYERAASKAEEIRSAIEERRRLMNLGQDTSKITSQIRRSLNELSLSLSGLEDLLVGSAGITDMEMERRRTQIRNLKAVKDDLQSQYSRISRPEDRASLLASPSDRRVPTETSHTANMDSSTLLQQQSSIMRDQDQGLDLLSQSIARQKQLGLAIGGELDEQNVMLEELGVGMDNTHSRLQRETKHVVYITEKAKTGGMLCCIVLLILVIILVAAIPF